MTYKEYLLTDKWKEKSKKCKEAYNYKCNRCGSEKELQAHHITYDNVGEEPAEDLECLCRVCHEKEHGNPSGSFKMYGFSIKRL